MWNPIERKIKQNFTITPPDALNYVNRGFYPPMDTALATPSQQSW